MAVGFPVKADYVTGDVLTANNMNDLSGTLNTIQSVEYAAGKNKVINGDFRINQRAFTSTTTTGTYTFDRFITSNSDGTVTYTPQTFTPGAAPVAGYEATNFVQIVTTGQTLTTAVAALVQRIEDVRTLAGQTATVSFYAKANTGTPNINVVLFQNFGSGGSPSATTTNAGTVQTITTSWARYSFTIAVPSISGKTIGTTANTSLLLLNIFVSGGSASNAPTVGIQSNTFQIWGVQVEASTIASDFQTATGTIQGELAACQRYYQRISGTDIIGSGQWTSTTTALIVVPNKVNMRNAPTISATITNFNVTNVGGSAQLATAVATTIAGPTNQLIQVTTAAVGVAGNGTVCFTNGANGILEMSSEL